MSRNLLIFGVGLIILVLAVATFVSRHSQTEVSSVPANWKVVNLDLVSFSIPPDMKEQSAKGTDLAVWKYRGTNMHIEVQYGVTTTDPEYFADQPEYLEEHMDIEGKKVKVVTFKLEDSKIATFSDDLLRYVTAARIVDEERGAGNGVTVWVTCLDKSEQKLAKKVVGSVRFKSS